VSQGFFKTTTGASLSFASSSTKVRRVPESAAVAPNVYSPVAACSSHPYSSGVDSLTGSRSTPRSGTVARFRAAVRKRSMLGRWRARSPTVNVVARAASVTAVVTRVVPLRLNPVMKITRTTMTSDRHCFGSGRRTRVLSDAAFLGLGVTQPN